MAYAAQSMETVVDIAGNEEGRVEDCNALQKSADPVVYQLVRVHNHLLVNIICLCNCNFILLFNGLISCVDNNKLHDRIM